MDVDRGQRSALTSDHRRKHRPLKWIALVVGSVVVGSLLIPSTASAVAVARELNNGGIFAVRSGDGCKLRPNRISTTPLKLRRDYTCAAGKGPSTAGPASVTLNTGDTLTIVSGDGCALKPAKLTATPVKFRRDLLCAIKGKPVKPTNPPVVPPTTGQPPSGVTGGATWRTVFADDFTGTAVNNTRWNVQNNSNFGTGNREDQCYRSANVAVGFGVLNLTGRRQTVTNCGSNPDGGNAYYFTSGMVTTRQQGGSMKFKFRHGYAEIRMRAPRGNIYWPAFWLVGAGDGSSPGWPAYGEMDVTEIYGSKPDISETNGHYPGSNGNPANFGARLHNVNRVSGDGININPPNVFRAGATNSWHTYGIHWTSNRLNWYIDGFLVRTFNATLPAQLAAFGYEHSINLNLAMGGNGPRYVGHGYTGGETSTGYNNGNLVADMPSPMQIDYVKVWQQ